jgi:hypothetical protein
MNEELGIMWKALARDCFKVLSWYFGRTEETHDKAWDDWCLPKFEPGATHISSATT